MQRKAISFKGQKVFIGIDVHKKTWSVTTLLEVGMPKTHSQKASAKELFDFLNRHYPEAEYHAVYEAGFSGFSTYYALKEYGIECTVVNAADVPTTQYESVMKSDPIDSDKMARALRAGMIRGIYIREKDNLDDRGLVRLRKSIQQDLTRYKNRVKHLLHANGVEIPELFDRSPNWSKAFINWLREDVVLLSSSRVSLDMLIEQVETLRQNLLTVTRKVRALRLKEEYAEKYDALTSIPGIGPICAITLLTEIYDVKRFRNERQFASYLGLVPTCHSSGEKASFGEMTFRGNKHLGPLLIEASWVAIHWDAALSVAFTNYRRKGLMPQESIIRVARKLSNIIFAMLKTGNHYAPANA